jgi:hypothetical protein
MQITKKHIKNFEIKPPKKSAFAIDTPEDIPKLHTLMILSGKRGGGKSVAITNYIAKLKDNDLIDRVLLVSPTYPSNKEIYAPLGLSTDDIIEPSKHTIKDINSKLDEEAKKWDDYQYKLALYKRFKKEMDSELPIGQINPDVIMMYHKHNFFNKEPEWDYNKVVPPRVFAIIDDMMGTPLMLPSSGLVNMCIKHRHLGKCETGGVLGLSIAMLVQSYACQNGLNRAIRENTCQLALFKNTDDNQIKKIVSEMGDVDEEKFRAMFEYATNEPFGFLFVDFAYKDKSKQFRKNFNEYLI